MSAYKKCLSCRYYLEHYVILDNCLRPIGGHCTNHELIKSRKRNLYALQDNCDKWEDNGIVKEEQHRSLQSTIEFMCKQLSQILKVLEAEKDITNT